MTKNYSMTQLAVNIAIVINFLVVALLPITTETKAACIIVLSITFWATGIIPQWFTALLFFVLCAISGVVPNDIFLSGFVSPAIWLLIAGSLMGLAIKHTGLGERLARYIAPLMTSYRRALLGSSLMGFVLIFIMPSATGRVIILLPLLLPIIEQLGYKNNTHARNGILVSAILSTFYPAFTVLPANVPNNILLGMVKNLFTDTPTYTNYLLLHFPVLGLLKYIMIIAIVITIYKAPHPNVIKAKPTAISLQEKKLLGILAITLMLWITEPLHGISTAWVAMLAAVICVFPHFGLTPPSPLSAIKFEAVFYIAAIVSVGAVAYHSGLANLIAASVIAILPFEPGNDFKNFGIFSAVSTSLSMIVTLPGTPAILTPMTQSLASHSDWSLQAVYMTQVIGFSTVIFPYQSPPLVVGMQLGAISLREMMKPLIAITFVTIVILWPLDYLWWRLLGII